MRPRPDSSGGGHEQLLLNSAANIRVVRPEIVLPDFNRVEDFCLPAATPLRYAMKPGMNTIRKMGMMHMIPW